jgi:large subunit ribosomal protein L9
MEVILKSNVEGLGKALDLVSVKPGYAQNYLFPRQLASLATPENKALLEQDRAKAEEVYLEEKKVAEELAAKLQEASVTIAAKVVEDEKLYGSVSTNDIAARLKEAGFELDRKQILLVEPIKNLGMYSVKVHLPPDVEASVKVWVISDESEDVE